MNSDFILTSCLLYVLAVVDCMFVSYRSAGGRNGLIKKRAYFTKACAEGAIFAQIPISVAGLLAFLIYSGTGNKPQLLEQFTFAGHAMLEFYLVFTLFIALALLIRCMRSVDARTIAQILVLGPFTFVRPYVAILGACNAILRSPHTGVTVVVCATVLMMLGTQFYFDSKNRYPNFLRRKQGSQ